MHAYMCMCVGGANGLLFAPVMAIQSLPAHLE